jgi:hypothetical protein
MGPVLALELTGVKWKRNRPVVCGFVCAMVLFVMVWFGSDHA